MIPFPYLSAHPTGSRYTVSPAVLNTDDDWLVLVEDLKSAEAVLEQSDPFIKGFARCYHPYDNNIEPGPWSAWRGPGDINLIVTDDRTLYLRKVAATLLCAKLNLVDKEDRIALFRAVQGGGEYYGRLP